MGPEHALILKEYARALEGFDAVIREYPDLSLAHERRAYILATSPDPRLRNGKAAVVSATRACELTTWHDANVISTLAAAYAESGDFASAVHYEKMAQDLCLAQTRRVFQPDRMMLFLSGEPYRDSR